jgi:hypothetical protein
MVRRGLVIIAFCATLFLASCATWEEMGCYQICPYEGPKLKYDISLFKDMPKRRGDVTYNKTTNN